MIYKTSDTNQVKKAIQNINKWSETDCKFELKKVSNSRTSQQNRALHLYFSFVANELNELGLMFKYTGLRQNGLESRYTSNIVKNFIWRPIQISMFNIESTKDLTTEQMNEIIDTITLFFGERSVNIHFPSIDTLIK
jgi:hypothetical protein